MPLVEGIAPIGGKRGRPLMKPKCVQADRGYDSARHRLALQRQGIGHQIAKRRTAHGSNLGTTRWVVERTIAWLHQFRRLRVRYERLPSIHEAFLRLGCAVICWRSVKNSFC
jgi:transposase